MSKDQGHTILLIQPKASADSRTYTDHPSVNAAVNSLVSVFEAAFRDAKKLRPNQTLSYATNDVLEFLDSLEDISMLTLDGRTNAYKLHDRKFVKNRVYQSIARQQVL